MNRDLGRLRINELIVHDVPKPVRGEDGELDEGVIELSEIESPLTSRLTTYFTERIVSYLGTKAYQVEFDGGSASPVPTLVLDSLGPQTTSFVAASQSMARHLYGSQTRRNTAGLLVVIRATMEGLPCLSILKIEREDGIRVHSIEHNGKPTFEIELLDDLMLTKNTRVFKAGLFVQEGVTLESIGGKVADTQQGSEIGNEVAGFFLTKFLGCRPREAPEETTKRFFEMTEAYINEQVTDPETKARYHIALLASLSDQGRDVQPTVFARQHLDLPDRNDYVRILEEAGVPTTQFAKNTARIEQRLRRTRLDFASGLALSGPPEEFDRHVRIESMEDGRARIEIDDRIAHIRG